MRKYFYGTENSNRLTITPEDLQTQSLRGWKYSARAWVLGGRLRN